MSFEGISFFHSRSLFIIEVTNFEKKRGGTDFWWLVRVWMPVFGFAIGSGAGTSGGN